MSSECGRHGDASDRQCVTFLDGGRRHGRTRDPALAVARELRSRGQEVFFVGTERGLEAKLVPAEGFPLERIEIGGLNRVGLRQTLATLLQLPVSTLRSLRLLRARRPAAVFSMGGYVAGPPVIAALLRRIPVVVMEPNAVPGFTNRRDRPLCRARAGLVPGDRAPTFPKGRTEITGLPVREEFFQLPPKPRGDVFTVLITGGSQGSRTLNQAARQSWPLFRNAGLPVQIRAPDRARRVRGDCATSSPQTGLDGRGGAASSPICRRRSPRRT